MGYYLTNADEKKQRERRSKQYIQNVEIELCQLAQENGIELPNNISNLNRIIYKLEKCRMTLFFYRYDKTKKLRISVDYYDGKMSNMKDVQDFKTIKEGKIGFIKMLKTLLNNQ